MGKTGVLRKPLVSGTSKYWNNDAGAQAYNIDLGNSESAWFTAVSR